MFLVAYSIWGCIPELAKECQDMTNSSSTYFGIIMGAIIGAVISWWIYNRQKKTSRMQDEILRQIERLEEKNGKILAHLETFASHHETILNKIFQLNERILALEKRLST